MARGPLNITVSIHGFCGTEYLARSGAQAGDVVSVTGPLGAAGLALKHPELSAEFSIQELSNVPSSDPRYPLRRYYLPEPRVAIGQRLVGIASAAIDLSDGLAADLRHICEASAVGAELAAEKVPLSPGCSLNSALHGGDDYELCVTIPRSGWRHAVELAHQEGLALCAVGEITHHKTMVLTRDGAVVEALAGGYQHFKH